MTYREKLWEEIARNDPTMAKALASAKPYKPTLMKFVWLKEPKHVFCKYTRTRESNGGRNE